MGRAPECEVAGFSGGWDPVDAGEGVLEGAALVGPELGIAEAWRQRRDLQQVGAGRRVLGEGLESERVEPQCPGFLGAHRRRTPDLGELLGEPQPGGVGLGVRGVRPLEHAQQFGGPEAEGKPALPFRRQGHHRPNGGGRPLEVGQLDGPTGRRQWLVQRAVDQLDAGRDGGPVGADLEQLGNERRWTEALPGRPAMAGHDQAVLGAGEGDVQEAALLFQVEIG